MAVYPCDVELEDRPRYSLPSPGSLPFHHAFAEIAVVAAAVAPEHADALKVVCGKAFAKQTPWYNSTRC